MSMRVGDRPKIEIQIPSDEVLKMQGTNGRAIAVTGNLSSVTLGGERLRVIQELNINVKHHELVKVDISTYLRNDETKQIRIKGRLIIDEYEEIPREPSLLDMDLLGPYVG